MRPLSRIIPLLRPLRPPNSLDTFPQSTFFNSRNPYRFVSRQTSRPQIPFLFARLKSKTPFYAIRPVSTETKDYIRYQIQLGAYWTVILWVLAGGGFVGYMWLRQDWLDKQYPAPSEWDLAVRGFWQKAKHEEDTEGFGRGEPDHSKTGSSYRELIIWIERGLKWHSGWLGGLDPALPRAKDWDNTIPGLDAVEVTIYPESPFFRDGKIGPDISDKPEHWKRAFFEANTGLAKAAEMNYGWFVDTSQGLTFPREYIKGPSNLYPKPIPPSKTVIQIPLEENCQPFMEDPSLFYIHILTTKGYNNSQRVSAGLAYAAWLDYLQETSLAESVCRWSLDLALDSLPSKIEPQSIINRQTGVIKAEAPVVTGNILAASTQLATHYAMNGSTSLALNIYLSVLRARRAAPDVPWNEYYPPNRPDYSLRSAESLIKFIMSLASASEMPPPPPSGDTPFQRRAADICEDAALMTYAGEILFATGKLRRKEGLAWTRDAVDWAQKGHDDQKLNAETRKKCTKCLEAALENWSRMVGVLANEERQAKAEGKSPNKTASWSFWGANGGGEALHGDWEEEETKIKDKKTKLQMQKLDRLLSTQISHNSSWFVA